MATLQAIKKRLLILKGNEGNIGLAALNSSSENAADLIASQLAQGIKSDGEKADFTYAPLTIAIKKTRQGLASVTSHLTNFNTGESYNKLYFKAASGKVEFGTESDKEAAISDRMDGKAFNLTPDNKKELLTHVTFPIFRKKINEMIKL